MSDLIRREDVIEAIFSKPAWHGSDGSWYHADDIKDALENAPSATAWIPCSERLPSEDGDYLVRLSDECLEDYSEFSEIEIMPFEVDCEGFGYWTNCYDPISLGLVDSDWHEFSVLAWMPLPKPYKETGHE